MSRRVDGLCYWDLAGLFLHGVKRSSVELARSVGGWVGGAGARACFCDTAWTRLVGESGPLGIRRGTVVQRLRTQEKELGYVGGEGGGQGDRVRGRAH